MTVGLLKDDSVAEQLRVLVAGIAGAAPMTIMGALAMKSGDAMVTVTAAVAVGPAMSVLGGVGMVGLGAYWAVNRFDQYKELTALETERMNLHVAMEQVQESITAQRTSLTSSHSSLKKIADHCGVFSRIPGFTLNRIPRRTTQCNW